MIFQKSARAEAIFAFFVGFPDFVGSASRKSENAFDNRRQLRQSLFFLDFANLIDAQPLRSAKNSEKSKDCFGCRRLFKIFQKSAPAEAIFAFSVDFPDVVG